MQVVLFILLLLFNEIISFNSFSSIYRKHITTTTSSSSTTTTSSTTTSSSSSSCTVVYMSGYIPPERDAEYRRMVKKSLLKPIITSDPNSVNINEEVALPVPKEGDIVLCPGKWKGESVLGRIRFMRYSQPSEAWVAEVIPLMEGKSNNVYVVDRKAASLSEPIASLRPVLSFFLRSENGYKISYRKNTTEIILKAPSYRSLAADFKFPQKAINETVLASDMITYAEIKARIVSNTLKAGAIGTVGSLFVFNFNIDISLSYFLGALSGAFYLILLGKKVDQVGAGFSVGTAPAPTKADEILAKSRFAVPLFLIGVLSAKNIFVDRDEVSLFHLLSKEQFLSAIGGFLTYRLSLFATEVASEFRTEDVLSIAPGSFAESYRLAKKMKKDGVAVDNEPSLTTVVFITGPRAAGRTTLATALAKNIGTNSKTNQVSKTKNEPLKVCKFLTTNPGLWQTNPTKYRIVSVEELEQLKLASKIVYEGEEKNTFGASAPVYLSIDDVVENGDKNPVLLEGPPAVLEALKKNKNLRLLNIWISLQTKEQFIEKATSIVQTQALQALQGAGNVNREELAQKSAQQVSDLVNEAARDVTFYMQKAPLFEYTLLNSGDEDQTLDELEQLLANTL